MSTEPTNKLKVTPGEAVIGPSKRKVMVGEATIAAFGRAGFMENEAYKNALANATLYLDAHNTYNKTFLLPSELADQLEEARRIITENRGRIWQAHQETYRGCGLSYEKACKSADIAMVSIDEYISRTKPQTPNPDGKEHA